MLNAPIFLLATTLLCHAVAGPLAARGYVALPAPRQVTLGESDFAISSDWTLVIGRAVPAGDAAVDTLREELSARFGIALARAGAKAIHLEIAPGSVANGEEAYEIDLAHDAITIKANAPPGLFYGVATLIQLPRESHGALWLPEGTIVDWPDLQNRHIYWDDAHHLEKLPELKRVLRQAALFKINGFALKLEGHFQYSGVGSAVVEPYALTPAEYQELTGYGLRYHIELIPYLDAPAHIAFILKHPEYAKLREFPDSNYEFCSTNPESYKLLFGMFDDLLGANKGVKHFYLSTDEPYYIGMADNAQCDEAKRARELGSVGKLLAEFVAKAGGYLHDHGRTVFFWGEYPMKVDDLKLLPPFVVNGEVYGPEFDPVYKSLGIRQMIYTSSEGEEQLFPDYFILPPSRRVHPAYTGTPRVPDSIDKISFDSSRQQSDLIGEVNAGWADMGLHPETFWMGYLTSAAAGWNPGSMEAQESMSAFYKLFYGPRVAEMDRVYRLMSEQAQNWYDSWETVRSSARKPIWGNSDRIYTPGMLVHDQTLPLPTAPGDDLSYDSAWRQDNARRLDLAAQALRDNDELLELLYSNLALADRNRANLEVFVSIAKLCRQNLEMLTQIGRMEAALHSAVGPAHSSNPKEALASVDQALGLAARIKFERNGVLRDTAAVWYQGWQPRAAEANGRKFLHELDDVKDHLPDRTVDMSYLVYRQLLLPLGDWVKQIEDARNHFAAANGLAERHGHFDWSDIKSTVEAEDTRKNQTAH